MSPTSFRITDNNERPRDCHVNIITVLISVVIIWITPLKQGLLNLLYKNLLNDLMFYYIDHDENSQLINDNLS